MSGRTYPRCAAPSCDLAADVSVTMAGEFGEVHGVWCSTHAAQLQQIMPYERSSLALLRAVCAEDLQAALEDDI